MAKSQIDLLNKAYNDYVTQLNKNKVSAQTAIASSTEKAKSLLDNRLKAQGLNNSGVGLSQYTALANQQNANLAQSNQAYNTELANKTYQYNNDLATYQQKYNDQIKSEAQSLLPNMTEQQANDYLNTLRGNENISDDTHNYLSRYLNTVNSQKGEQALDTAKSDLSQLSDYSSIQRYLENARANGTLSDNQIATLQSYVDVLGYGWQNTKESYANELVEMMNTVGVNSNDYGKLLSAYQQINGAKSQQELNNVLNSININGLIDSVGTNRSAIDEWSNISTMYNGDSISQSTLNYLAEQGIAKKSGNKYTTNINGTTYTFDSNGKLISGGMSKEETNNQNSNIKDYQEALSNKITNNNTETKSNNQEITNVVSTEQVNQNSASSKLKDEELVDLKGRLNRSVGATLSSSLKKILETFPATKEKNSNGAVISTIYQVGSTKYRLKLNGQLEKLN